MSRYSNSTIYIALPVMDELEYLNKTLNCIRTQTYNNYIVYICVNQPDSYWDDETKHRICRDNQETIQQLRTINDLPIHILDYSSKGNGWKGKKFGVGWARKVLMDSINSIANPDDIILSLDADTEFKPEYFRAVINACNDQTNSVALSVPYYHKLNKDDVSNRAILHYEIYMRYYSLNMWRIGSPYNFTALGSAIAVPLWAYSKIGGITPHKSGEDFYFLQKLRKTGSLNLWCREKIYPAARFSDRVFFGTGPAMIKGKNENWDSYPMYKMDLFNKVKELYSLFPVLYKNNVSTPFDTFIKEVFKEESIWDGFRKNYKSNKQFVKACHDKFDGLRILQFLKREQEKYSESDENNLFAFLEMYYPSSSLRILKNNQHFQFNKTPVKELNIIRDLLLSFEEKCQQVGTFVCDEG